MGSYDMRNGVSQYVRDAVTQINKVGVANLRRYFKRFHPRTDFGKGILLIRSVAQLGYTDAALKHNVSKQHAHRTLQRYYEIAKEAERWQEKL